MRRNEEKKQLCSCSCPCQGLGFSELQVVDLLQVGIFILWYRTSDLSHWHRRFCADGGTMGYALPTGDCMGDWFCNDRHLIVEIDFKLVGNLISKGSLKPGTNVPWLYHKGLDRSHSVPVS